ncbi:MAG: hypothetical protein HYZ53_14185 [Planctomycetes bacterium]|nr:hypothetical protein [Planctomycetota bacterium]
MNSAGNTKTAVLAVFAIPSLLVCLAATGMWVRSSYARDEWVLSEAPKSARVVVSERGRISRAHVRLDEATEIYGALRTTGDLPTASGEAHAALEKARGLLQGLDDSWIGFGAQHHSHCESITGKSFTAEEWWFGWTTYSLLASLSGILPAAWAWRTVRRRFGKKPPKTTIE